MAFSWPQDLDTYLFNNGPAKVSMRKFRLSESRRLSGVSGGEMWSVSRGTRLWYGNISIVPQRTVDQMFYEARMEYLVGSNGTFYIRDFMAEPLAEPQTAAVLATVAANNIDISLSGMTPGLFVRAGTCFAFDYNGTQRAFHRALHSYTVKADGTTPIHSVMPALKPGYVKGTTTVNFDKPKLKAIILPNTLEMGEADYSNSSGISFDWIQTLRP